jgi:hypothetical protein
MKKGASQVAVVGRMRRRVWFTLGGVCLVIGCWALWTRSRPVHPSAAERLKQPFVQLAGADSAAGSQLLQERAQLMDPTPLFFPTEWNFGQQPLSENLEKQPGRFFGDFPPKPTIDEKTIATYGAGTPVVPEKLADVLTLGVEAPFAGMGQVDRAKALLPIRAGYLDINDLANGQLVASHALSGLVLPRMDFAPVEFLLVVESAGLVGEPILVVGSGQEEVDNYFRTYLVKSYRVGARLPPGRYRVWVGA